MEAEHCLMAAIRGTSDLEELRDAKSPPAARPKRCKPRCKQDANKLPAVVSLQTA
jgi:hypothetical protein